MAGEKWSGVPKDKRQILELLDAHGGQMTGADIAIALGMTDPRGRARLNQRLSRMVKDGFIRRLDQGIYALPMSCQSECHNDNVPPSSPYPSEYDEVGKPEVQSDKMTDMTRCEDVVAVSPAPPLAVDQSSSIDLVSLPSVTTNMSDDEIAAVLGVSP